MACHGVSWSHDVTQTRVDGVTEIPSMSQLYNETANKCPLIILYILANDENIILNRI